MDLLVGGLSAFYETDDLASTVPFMNDDFAFCVARSELMPLYLGIMHVFTPTLWIFIFATGFVIAILFFVVTRLPGNEKRVSFHYAVLAVVFHILINGPTVYVPKNVSTRILLSFLWFFGIIFFCQSFVGLQYRARHPYRNEQVRKISALKSGGYSASSTPDILHRIELMDKVRAIEIKKSLLETLFHSFCRCIAVEASSVSLNVQTSPTV